VHPLPKEWRVDQPTVSAALLAHLTALPQGAALHATELVPTPRRPAPPLRTYHQTLAGIARALSLSRAL
jgi:hypothetical protein